MVEICAIYYLALVHILELRKLMRLYLDISINIVAILGSMSLCGQLSSSISFQEIPKRVKIVKVSFSELYENLEEYINKTVEFSGNIDCYTEHQYVHPAINQGDYSKMIWYKFPERAKQSTITQLSGYSGSNATITARVIALPKNHSRSEGKGDLILYKVVIHK